MECVGNRHDNKKWKKKGKKEALYSQIYFFKSFQIGRGKIDEFYMLYTYQNHASKVSLISFSPEPL